MEINKCLQYSQNFCRKKLCGQSFKGQDLSGADFSQADIRGANFSQANLQQANFSQCRAGLTPQQTILLILFSWLLSGIARLLLGLTIYVSLIALILPSLLMQSMSDYVPGVEWAVRLTPVLFGIWVFFSLCLEPISVGM